MNAFKPVPPPVAQSLARIRPGAPIAQAHGVVVPVCEAEPHQQPARRLGAQRIDQLFSQQAHRRGAENDDALFVEANDAFIRPKIEQLGELHAAVVHPPTIPRTGGAHRHADQSRRQRQAQSDSAFTAASCDCEAGRPTLQRNANSAARSP